MVTVRFFAGLREVVGRSEIDLDVRSGATVEEVFGRLRSDFPGLAPYRPLLLVAINEEYAPWERPLVDGDELAFFPPVSGGA